MVDFVTSKRIGFSQGLNQLGYTCPRSRAGSLRHRTHLNGGVPLSEPDSIEKFKADLAAEPDAGAVLRAELHDQAEHFLTQCVLAARKIELLDDVWKARDIMTEVTIWAVELKNRLTKETAVIRRPKNTIGAFKR